MARWAASAVKANGGISGPWRLVINVGGNTLTGDCDLAQDGPKLGGTCSVSSEDRAPVTGSVEGAKVAFAFPSILAANNVNLRYEGTLDADGAKIVGTSSLLFGGQPTEFTLTRK
jgi:hypothetical protein